MFFSLVLFFYVCAKKLDWNFFQSAIQSANFALWSICACTLKIIKIIHCQFFYANLQNLFQKIKCMGDVMTEKFGKKCYLCSMKKSITYY